MHPERDAVTTLRRLFVHELTDSDDIVRFVRELRPELSIALLQTGHADLGSETQSALVVTRNAESRDSLVRAGFERGLIIAKEELLGQFEL